MDKLNGRIINRGMLISLIITIATSWWILIYKEGTMHYFVWGLFFIAFITSWVMCIKLFYKSHRNQRRLNSVIISLVFDLLILHTVMGCCGILLSSDEGSWHIRDLAEFVPFWLYLMSITYCVVMGVINIKEKKFIRGIGCICLCVIIVIAGWMLIMAWVRREIGIWYV